MDYYASRVCYEVTIVYKAQKKKKRFFQYIVCSCQPGSYDSVIALPPPLGSPQPLGFNRMPASQRPEDMLIPAEQKHIVLQRRYCVTPFYIAFNWLGWLLSCAGWSTICLPLLDGLLWNCADIPAPWRINRQSTDFSSNALLLNLIHTLREFSCCTTQ